MYYNIHLGDGNRNVLSPSEVQAFGLSDEQLKNLGIFNLSVNSIILDNEIEIHGEPIITGDVDTGFTLSQTKKFRDVNIVKDCLKSRLKKTRLRHEFGGVKITETGTMLDSSRIDGQMIHNAYVGSELLEENTLIDFCSASGWVTITKEILGHLFMVYATHVEACFTREKEIYNLIDSASTSEDAVDTFKNEIKIGWPNYDN